MVISTSYTNLGAGVGVSQIHADIPTLIAVAKYYALPDISAYGTVQGDCVREDFWLIVTARSGDETEIRERERSCRTVRS